jgi:hypothetical protein
MIAPAVHTSLACADRREQKQGYPVTFASSRDGNRVKARSWISLAIWSIALVGIAGLLPRDRVTFVNRCAASNISLSTCWLSVATAWELP